MFDWKEYIKFADELYQNRISLPISAECRLRNCISRAYYGAFGEARKFCENQGIFSPMGTADDHENLKQICFAQSDFDYKKIGHNLEWLRLRRNCCDYEDDLAHCVHIKGKIYDAADKAMEKAEEINGLLIKLQGIHP